MSEKYPYEKGKRYFKHFSNDKERNMMEIADEEYLEINPDENDELKDEFYNSEMLGFYDWNDF